MIKASEVKTSGEKQQAGGAKRKSLLPGAACEEVFL